MKKGWNKNGDSNLSTGCPIAALYHSWSNYLNPQPDSNGFNKPVTGYSGPMLYTSVMPDVKHPKYDHPKCGAKMQQVSTRDHFYFRTLVVGWVLIMDCSTKGMCKRSGNTRGTTGSVKRTQRYTRLRISE